MDKEYSCMPSHCQRPTGGQCSRLQISVHMGMHFSPAVLNRRCAGTVGDKLTWIMVFPSLGVEEE